MRHYLMLSRKNFYDEKQHSNKVLPFGARGSRNYASPCIIRRMVQRRIRRVWNLSVVTIANLQLSVSVKEFFENR